jgi:exopolysaccharide biosynthesis predicted pyruvyltransferase EpsI
VFRDLLEDSRRRLLGLVAGEAEVTLVLSWGNVGDQLIYAGLRQLLAQVDYREVKGANLSGVSGRTALLTGGGSWCRPWHEMPKVLAAAEERFEKVIVLPSSYDTSEPTVREALRRSKALFFAREEVSLRQIRDLCRADLALDTAFFFDYRPYRGRASGVLNAFRTDAERGVEGIPAEDNRDISAECENLDEWLWAISRKELIRTDRAHVMIAGALMGKRVEYRPSSYHKVPAIARYALRDFGVTEMKRG